MLLYKKSAYSEKFWMFEYKVVIQCYKDTEIKGV